MIKTHILKKKVIEFYSELVENENHRFESWEHCYKNFQNAFKQVAITDKEKDILSLHLAFYLASWGMYRGSSFILQKDYKIFYPIVDLLVSEKAYFNESRIEDLLENGNNELFKLYVNEYFEFDSKLNKILNDIRLSVKQNTVSDVSYTLKTKIILGTYGLVPAYDRFFKDGLRQYNDPNLLLSYSHTGIVKMLHFAKNNLNELKQIKRQIANIQKGNNVLNAIDYPYMKIVDMYFWKIGFDLDENKK